MESINKLFKYIKEIIGGGDGLVLLLVLLNGIIAFSTQILLYRNLSDSILSDYQFIWFFTNLVAFFPNTLGILVTKNEYFDQFSLIFYLIVFIAIPTGILGAFYLRYTSVDFETSWMCLLITVNLIIAVAKRGLILTKRYILDQKLFTVGAFLKLTCIICLIYCDKNLRPEFIKYFVLIDFIYLMILYKLLKLDVVSISKIRLKWSGIFYSARHIFLNYAFYSILTGTDRFYLKQSPEDFVLVTAFITYIGYGNILFNALLDKRSSMYLGLTSKNVVIFNKLVYYPVLKYAKFIFGGLIVLSPFYFSLLGLRVNVLGIICFILFFLSTFLNAHTKSLNVLIHQKGLFDVQLKSTLFSLPLLLLLFFQDYVSIILISTLISFFTSLVCFLYTKYILNENNLLYNHIQST